MRLSGHSDGVQSVSYFHDGKRAITSSMDRTARIWDLASGKQLLSLEGHHDGINSVAVSPDDSLVATASNDTQAAVWDANTGEMVSLLLGHKYGLTGVGFLGNNNTLVTISQDGTMRVWDIPSERQTALLCNDADQDLEHLSLTPDGNYVVAAGHKGTIFLVNVKQQRIERQFNCTAAISSVIISEDGSRVYAACDEKPRKFYEWDAGTGEQIASCKIEGSYNTIGVSPNGKFVAVDLGCSDIQVYSLPRCEKVLRFLEPGNHLFVDHCIQFSPDGKSMIDACGGYYSVNGYQRTLDNVARVWRLPITLQR
ncbi:MAG: WD40 repeat domain-containing protein [Planctomycetota bacterium]|nr:WD40 repeat domain-containing protein [Planctomycetota bacterium]